MSKLTFAEKLKTARAKTGMSQQKISDKMLIPKRTIESWEAGKRTPPEYLQRFVLNELESLKHEPIVDPDTWAAVQAKLKQAPKDTETQQDSGHDVLSQSHPLGYELKDGELIPNHEEEAAVRKGIHELLKKKHTLSPETQGEIRSLLRKHYQETKE